MSFQLSNFRCGHCKKMAPEFDSASTILADNDPPVTLVKVSTCVVVLMLGLAAFHFVDTSVSRRIRCEPKMSYFLAFYFLKASSDKSVKVAKASCILTE